MKTLTDRQKTVLEFIRSHIERHGFPPTIREIGRALGIRSTNGVVDHLKALERKGYLMRDDFKSRALIPVRSRRGDRPQRDRPLPQDRPSRRVARRKAALRLLPAAASPPAVPTPEVREVPVVGRVAAGSPLLAEENLEGTVWIDLSWLGTGGRVFALRITGDSMVDAGIHDGDYVLVRRQPTARYRDLVVVMIDGEATVKRYLPRRDRLVFMPANEAFEPIVVRRRDARSVELIGVVVGVYRRL